VSISSAFAGVSCDACMKSNFSSLRFKCLVCYDYDLCASCRDSGATSSRHTASHPMQCIMTRADLSKNFAYVFFLSTKTFHHFWLPLCVCVCVCFIQSASACYLLTLIPVLYGVIYIPFGDLFVVYVNYLCSFCCRFEIISIHVCSECLWLSAGFKCN